MDRGAFIKKTSIVFRNSGNALSVFYARTYATCCVNIICIRNSSAQDSLYMPRLSRCIRLTLKRVSRNWPRQKGSVIATSPNVVLRSVPKISRSPITRSFPLKNASLTSSMTPFENFFGSLCLVEARPARRIKEGVLKMSKVTYETEFTLKVLRTGAIPAALERAERYRLLNEPTQAESICLDILQVDPENQRALVQLLLSI